MNTKITLIAIVALFATTATFAQVGIGTTDPDAVSWQQATKTKHF